MLRTSRLGKALAFVVLLGSGGLALPAKATLILDLGPGGVSVPCGACDDRFGRTVGWAFDVTSTIQVNGLAAWDTNQTSFIRNVQSALWSEAGTLLASTTISGSSPTEPSSGDGVWRVESITALILTPGRYVLGQVLFQDDPIRHFSAPIITIPEVTLVGGRIASNLDRGLVYPSLEQVTPSFGPSMRLGVTQLPEPDTMALFGFGLGLVGIGSLIRRRRGL